MNDTMVRTEDFAVRCQKVLGVARQLYQSGPDWVTFFREVLGVEGAARKVFVEQNDFSSFEKSTEYADIQQMVNSLRTRKGSGANANEATRVITVRLPESLHEALKAEATDHNTSMNKLCIAKLLQVLADEEKAAPPTTMNRGQNNSPPRPSTAQPTSHSPLGHPMGNHQPGNHQPPMGQSQTGHSAPVPAFRSTWQG